MSDSRDGPPFAPSGPSSRLKEVLAEYMRREDLGEVVDRERFVAQYADCAEELRSYLAEEDEVRAMFDPGAAEQTIDPMASTVPGSPLAFAADVDMEQCFGGYELLEKIDGNSDAAVYRARQNGAADSVALKIVFSGPSTGALKRGKHFYQTAESAARLAHPRIVPVYTFGIYQGYYYVSMPLFEGDSLADRELDFVAAPRQAAQLLMDIAQAVYHAHQHGVVHGNLKPANILFDKEDQAYVSDFALSKRQPWRDEQTPWAWDCLGSPAYLAPEEAFHHAEMLAPTTDVYSLGAILYELLTGWPPFVGSTLAETWLLARRGGPRSPHKYNPQVDRNLEAICRKCMASKPAQRYQSAKVLAEELGLWLKPERGR